MLRDELLVIKGLELDGEEVVIGKILHGDGDFSLDFGFDFVSCVERDGEEEEVLYCCVSRYENVARKPFMFKICILDVYDDSLSDFHGRYFKYVKGLEGVDLGIQDIVLTSEDGVKHIEKKQVFKTYLEEVTSGELYEEEFYE